MLYQYRITQQRRRNIEELIRLHLKTGIDLLNAINIPSDEEEFDDLNQDLTKFVEQFNDQEMGIPKIEPSQMQLEDEKQIDWRSTSDDVEKHLFAPKNGNDDYIISKKKYQILGHQQLQELVHDLQVGQHTRQQLVNKYRISMTTLARYVRLFKVKRQQPTRKSNEEANSKVVKNHRQPLHFKAQKDAQLKIQGEGVNRKAGSVSLSMKCFPETNSPTNIHYRFLFMKELNKLDQQKLIFIDELRYLKKVDNPKSNFTISDPNLGFLEEINFILALGNYHVLHWKLKHRRLNEDEFISFLIEVWKKHPDCTILMDNNQLHKGKAVKLAIASHKIKVLYLPPRSPQLNPISMFYEHFKYQLAPLLYPEYNHKKMSEQTHKIFKLMWADGVKNPFFSRNIQYRIMSQKKQPFP